jgi:hypothetical protein
MTLHPFGPWIPAAISPLIIALSGWNFWRVKHAYRVRGRREVQRKLADRGETLIAIRDLPIGVMQATPGLSTTVAFQVTARTAEGAEQTYEWAYEPRIFPWQTEGLKRLAHGIWIPA